MDSSDDVVASGFVSPASAIIEDDSRCCSWLIWDDEEEAEDGANVNTV